jgi:hypothetical protein
MSCLAACVQEEGNQKENKLEDTLVTLQAKGLTCEVMANIEKFDENEFKTFSNILASLMSGEEFMALARGREIDCASSQQEGVGTISQALAGYNDSHTVESIEDDSIGGSSAQTTGWEVDPVGICGTDHDDGIWEVNNLPYSHQFRQYLRYTGTDDFGNCVEALSTAMSARVYLDNSIRMCVRSTWLGLCDNWYTPHDYSFTIGFD